MCAVDTGPRHFRLSPRRAVVLGAVALSFAAHGAALIALGTFGSPAPRGTLIDTPGVATELLTLTPRREPEPQPREVETPREVEPQAPALPAPPPVVKSELARPAPIAQPAPRPAPIAAQPAPAQITQPVHAIASFAGVEGTRARRVVYVLDASGPMTSCLPFVKAELERSVSRLSAEQSFQVIVTRRRAQDDAAEVRVFRSESAGFAPADARVCAALHDWLADVEPRWASDPLAGLEAAVREGPELVFLLTRSIRRSASGDVIAAGDAALARLDALNPADASGKRAAVIKIIQFLDEDPSGLLPRIAARHGDGEGSYRVMKLGELR